MAMTSAERQKKYRERNGRNAGKCRINLILAESAVNRLGELAAYHGVFKQVMLERVIEEYVTLRRSDAPITQESSEELATRLLQLFDGNLEKAVAVLRKQAKPPVPANTRRRGDGRRLLHESQPVRPLKRNLRVPSDRSGAAATEVAPLVQNPQLDQLMFEF